MAIRPIANLSRGDFLLRAGAAGAVLRKDKSRPMRIYPKNLEPIRARLLEKGINLSIEDMGEVTDLIKEEILYRYVNRLITQSEEIFSMDPNLTEKEIRKFVAKAIVEYFDAKVASL